MGLWNASTSEVSSPAIVTGLRRVIVLDTETTGLQPYDRMVSLAALRFEGEQSQGDLHRVYDPRKDSHPGALAVHGWDDWTLRFQDLFADDADEVREWLAWADVLVMHNAAFDMRYIARELRKAEVAPIEVDAFCTMEGAHRAWNGSARLDDCLSRLGLRRSGSRHGAYEDALLTACLYFHLQGSSYRPALPDVWPAPTNLRPAPARPEGPLPRRTTKRRAKAKLAMSAQSVAFDIAPIIERAKDGITVLRYVAEVGAVNVEAQADILDQYLDHIWPADAAAPNERQLALQAALDAPGDEATALRAARNLAALSSDVIALGPLITALVRVDGQATAEEVRAVQLVISTIRMARAR